MSENRTDKIINHMKAFEPGQYPVITEKEDAKIIVSALEAQAEREKGCTGCKVYAQLQRYHMAQENCSSCKGCIRIATDRFEANHDSKSG